jgi:site-specific recombinase XerC
MSSSVRGRARPDSIAEPDVLDNLASLTRHDRQDAGMRSATLSQRCRSLQQFFTWLAAEGETEGSPMATKRPPHVPETPPPVLPEAELRKLLDACAGTDFEGRRDITGRGRDVVLLERRSSITGL